MLLRTARCSEPPTGPRLIDWDSPHCRQLLVGHIGMNLVVPQDDANITKMRRPQGLYQPSYNYGGATFNAPGVFNAKNDPYTALWMAEGNIAYCNMNSYPIDWYGYFQLSPYWIGTPGVVRGYLGPRQTFDNYSIPTDLARHWYSFAAPVTTIATDLRAAIDGSVLAPVTATDGAGYDNNRAIGYQCGGGEGPHLSLALLFWRRVVPIEEQREIVDSGFRALLIEPVPRTWFFMSPAAPPPTPPTLLFYRRR